MSRLVCREKGRGKKISRFSVYVECERPLINVISLFTYQNQIINFRVSIKEKFNYVGCTVHSHSFRDTVLSLAALKHSHVSLSR